MVGSIVTKEQKYKRYQKYMVHDELSRAKTTSRPNSMMHKDQFVVTRNKKNPNYFRSTKYKTTYRNINGLEITRFIHVIGENLI